jgi:transcriptional regulator with XRE-family HTH domain
MLSDRLKKTMKERGYSQKELAERSHLTEAAISKYLSGYRTPHLEISRDPCESSQRHHRLSYGRRESLISSENYQLVYEMVQRNKGLMSPEEKMKLIALITM